MDRKYHDEISMKIDAGGAICKKLKGIYPQASWMEISRFLGVLKARGKDYFPDATENELLRQIEVHFSPDDIRDAIGQNQS